MLRSRRPRVPGGRHALALLAFLALPLSAHAQLDFPRPPTWRGSPCSLYAGFGTSCPPGFTSAFALPNAPDDPATSAGFAPTVRQLQPGAILTSTCNIYHPSLAPRCELALVVPGGLDAQAVQIQVRSAGNSQDPASFELRYGGGPTVLVASSIEVLGSAPAPEEVLVSWDLSANPDTIDALTIGFEGTASNISLDLIELDLLLEGCATGTPLCFGDGSGTPCPCGNSGALGHGCANAQVAAGALLDASGDPLQDDVLLTLSGLNPSGSPGVVIIRSPSASAGTAFGDGLLCLSAPVVRVGSGVATRGALALPLHHSAGAGSFAYQAWYRSTPASFCNPLAAFNLSNAFEIVWP